MPIDQLQSAATAFAPSPVEPSALQAQSSVATTGDAGGPAPMAIGSLQATMGSDAPTPVSFGALQDATAAPAPTLQTSGAAGAEAGDAPAPMSMQDLEAAANGGKGGSRKK
jgi:hypothetical protein